VPVNSRRQAGSGDRECDDADTGNQKEQSNGSGDVSKCDSCIAAIILSAAKVGGVAPAVIANIEAAVTSLLRYRDSGDVCAAGRIEGDDEVVMA